MDSPGLEGAGATALDDGAMDPRRLLSALLKRKWWILAPTLAAFCAALAFVTIVSPRYTAWTRVLLESQESYFTRPDKSANELATPLIYDAEGVQSEAESVATEELARKLVAKLGLSRNSEFNPPREVLGTLLGLLGGLRDDQDSEQRAAENVLSRLTVFAVQKSRVLQIEFSSADPALAAKGANAIAELYLDAKEEAQKKTARAASAWLSRKIDELRGRVAEADAKAEAFRSQSGLLAGSGGLTLPTQQLSEIAAQIAAARAAQTAAAAKAQLLRQMLREGRLDSVPDVAKDESLRRYAEARVTLKSQIAELGRTLLPGHPKMRELEGQLAGLDAEVRAAAAKVVRGLEDDAQLAGAQVANLEGAVAKQSKTVAAGNGDEVRLRELELDAKTARAQLESYIEKYHEAIAHEADNAAPPNARILSAAIAPRSAAFPKKAPILLMSALAGLFLSIGVVIARELLVDAPSAARTREPAPARPPQRLAEPESEPAQATSKATSNATPKAMPPDPENESIDALDAIVDRLAGASTPGVCLPVLVTSDGAGGALGAALSVARRFSKLGGAILLDLGKSQPWLPDVFDRAAESEAHDHRISDVLEGRVKFVDALHRDLSSRVDILLAGQAEIDLEGLAQVFDILMEGYAFVVVHASDWRAPAALAAAARVAAVALCAPSSRLGRVAGRLREALVDPAVSIETVALDDPPKARASRASAAR